jgi:hypothetical protein
MQNEQPCVERTRLFEALQRAVEATCAANINLLAAQKEKRDTAPLAVVLIKARSAEFAAISALEQHRKEHDC